QTHRIQLGDDGVGGGGDGGVGGGELVVQRGDVGVDGVQLAVNAVKGSSAAGIGLVVPHAQRVLDDINRGVDGGQTVCRP
ncbi:hypothetical protein VSS86_22635, partial [Bacillus safensis]|uniref:hypothetical protein n=1 Tax=Bacillus safensis TaxID=561879 RepID=UPI002DD44A12